MLSFHHFGGKKRGEQSFQLFKAKNSNIELSEDDLLAKNMVDLQVCNSFRLVVFNLNFQIVLNHCKIFLDIVRFHSNIKGYRVVVLSNQQMDTVDMQTVRKQAVKSSLLLTLLCRKLHYGPKVVHEGLRSRLVFPLIPRHFGP